jgi:hypothetical protein
MDTAMNYPTQEATKKNGQQGFTILEAVISAAVVTVGLVALLAVFAVAIGSTQTIQLDTIARQRATEALESVFTARETAQITFAQIQNQSAGGPGIFAPGMVALTDPGPDGLEDTADDVPPSPINVPGPTGSMTGANASITQFSLANFQRQVQINNVTDASGAVNPNLRQIVVTIQYPTSNGHLRSYTVQALISSYR